MTQSNQAHGLAQSNADKRKAVALLLGAAEWSQWSDREIARRCQVGHGTVSRLRQNLSGPVGQIAGRKVERNGTVNEKNVAAVWLCIKLAGAMQ
jgi:hypothetical protein